MFSSYSLSSSEGLGYEEQLPVQCHWCSAVIWPQHWVSTSAHWGMWMAAPLFYDPFIFISTENAGNWVIRDFKVGSGLVWLATSSSLKPQNLECSTVWQPPPPCPVCSEENCDCCLLEACKQLSQHGLFSTTCKKLYHLTLPAVHFFLIFFL